MNIANKYIQEVIPKLKEEFVQQNELSLPRIKKIVVNMGVSDAITNKDALEKARDQLAQITGQKPSVRPARKAISSFKLQKGDPIGLMVTLRGKRAKHFLEKLISVVIPRMRDFRGLNQANFDKFGNYSLGITEQILFPEIDYSKIDRVRGLVVTIVVKNSDPQKSQRLFEFLGLPFRKT